MTAHAGSANNMYTRMGARSQEAAHMVHRPRKSRPRTADAENYVMKNIAQAGRRRENGVTEMMMLNPLLTDRGTRDCAAGQHCQLESINQAGGEKGRVVEGRNRGASSRGNSARGGSGRGNATSTSSGIISWNFRSIAFPHIRRLHALKM